MTTLRAYIGFFYFFSFCLCLAFICVCNLTYFFGLKSWTLYWYIAFILFAYGWSRLIDFIFDNCDNFEHLIIAYIKGELPNKASTLVHGEFPDWVEIIKNWMPLLVLAVTWFLEKQYGSNLSSFVLFALGLGSIGLFAYREGNWRIQIPAWSIFLVSVFFPKNLNDQWQQQYDVSAIYIIRILSLLVAVVSLQYKKPYFLKILFSVWLGQVVLLMLLAFCIDSGLSKMGVKLKSGEEIKPLYVYLAFLFVALIFGFMFALKTAFVGTVRMGVLETFIEECLDALKVVAGFVVLSTGATAAYDAKNHILLILPITAILALYYGDVLDKKTFDKFEEIKNSSFTL